MNFKLVSFFTYIVINNHDLAEAYQKLMQIAIEESLGVGKNTLGFLQKHGCFSRWYHLAEALLALN